MKNAESPFGSEDVLSENTASSATSENEAHPDWMKDTSLEHEEEVPGDLDISEHTNTETSPAQNVPDWLQEDTYDAVQETVQVE